MKSRHSALLLFLLFSAPLAAETANQDWNLSGFGSIVLSQGDTDFAEYRTEIGQFEGIGDEAEFSTRSKLGVQADWRASSTFTVTAQVLAKQRELDSLEPEFEWLFASYAPVNWLDIRLGRMILPVFLVSDYRNVGFAQSLIEPPVLAYFEMPVSRFDGAQIITNNELAGGTVTFKVSAGESDQPMFVNGFPIKSDLEDIIGFNLLYTNNSWTFNVGHLDFDLKSRDNFVALQRLNLPVPVFAPTSFNESDYHTFGAQFDNGDWLVRLERVEFKLTGTPTNTSANTLTVSKRFGKWGPYINLSEKTDNILIQELNLLTQTEPDSKTLGLRYELTSEIALKVQWDRMEVQPFSWIVKDPRALDGEEHDIYGISLDFIF